MVNLQLKRLFVPARAELQFHFKFCRSPPNLDEVKSPPRGDYQTANELRIQPQVGAEARCMS